MERKDTIRYEDAAEKVIITGPDGKQTEGWRPLCNTNVIWVGSDAEHMARYTWATDFPCACGGRHQKGRIHCPNCEHKQDMERWAKAYAEKKELWDGKAFLCEWDGDRYFFDDDAVYVYLEERFDEGDKLEDVRLVFCKPNDPPYFEMSEYLCDVLPEDGHVDGAEISKTVNDWIKAHGPFSYYGDNNRPVDLESLREMWNQVVKSAEHAAAEGGA